MRCIASTGAGLASALAISTLICAPQPAQAAEGASAASATRLDPPALEPARGSEIGAVYEAFLSPMQEPDEEANTPKSVPKVFQSTAPSKTRAQRVADGHRGHGVIRFTKDFSRAYVDVKIEGITVKDINMFHIHCGKPGILGPILVDLSHVSTLQEALADGMLSVEVTNEVIVKTVEHAHGLVGSFTGGCVIPQPSLSGPVPSKVSTVAGMATIAREGELYFNLHTLGQTYYGDIRGQVLEVKK